jgi:hypothetical protein
VRRTLALVAAGAAAALAALILGEYQLTLWTSVAAGLIVGFLVAETILITADWRGVIPAAVSAVFAGGSILWAAWISSGHGLAPLRATAWAGVVLGALVGGGRLLVRSRYGAGAVNDAN